MFGLKSKGSFNNMDRFLKAIKENDIYAALESYARQGVAALESATPRATGITANSWDYRVTYDKGVATVAWTNSNIVAGTPLVILLQYGHGTGTGGYVEGRDFINPSLAPVFDKLADDVWKAVTSA